MAKNILKEAIADAKAVREVALANAKAALEEAFTPRLQSMLSAKLSETLNEEEDELDENKEEVEEGYYEEDKEGVDENFVEERTDLDEEIDLEEILSELELEEADTEQTVDEAKEEDLDEAKDKDEDTMDEAKEEDLDEVKKDEEDKLDEMEVIYKAETANRTGYQADYVHEGSGKFDLDALLEEINELDSDDNTVDEAKEETNEWADFSRANPDVSFNLKENDKEGMEELYHRIKETILQEKEEINTENLKNELEETREAFEAVKTELNEVNLLNSKLLYVNRIFKANTLVQKLRVVETLDKAECIKEAKLIYETIKGTFTISQDKTNKPKKSIRENLGMASKPAGSTQSPARNKPVLNESNDMVTRMQKLANIKIK